jgi:hypothetical protein
VIARLSPILRLVRRNGYPEFVQKIGGKGVVITGVQPGAASTPSSTSSIGWLVAGQPLLPARGERLTLFWVGQLQVAGYRLHHHVFDGRALTPIPVEGLEHQLDPRRERHELVGTGADRMLLEAGIADLFDIFLRNDPPGAAGARIEGQKVGPRLVELEADVPRFSCPIASAVLAL